MKKKFKTNETTTTKQTNKKLNKNYKNKNKQIQFLVSTTYVIAALGKAHMLKVALNIGPILVWLKQIVPDLGEWNIGRFLSPHLFH